MLLHNLIIDWQNPVAYERDVFKKYQKNMRQGKKQGEKKRQFILRAGERLARH